MCLQIFVDVSVVLCGFLYASIPRLFVFAQPVSLLHWLLCSPISALTLSSYARGVCELLKPSTRSASYDWGQISKPVRCQNICTTLCLHLLLSKIHKSRSALNNFHSPLPISSAAISSSSNRPAARRAAGPARGRGEDPPSSGALPVGQRESGGGPTSGKVSLASSSPCLESPWLGSPHIYFPLIWTPSSKSSPCS